MKEKVDERVSRVLNVPRGVTIDAKERYMEINWRKLAERRSLRAGKWDNVKVTALNTTRKPGEETSFDDACK